MDQETTRARLTQKLTMSDMVDEKGCYKPEAVIQITTPHKKEPQVVAVDLHLLSTHQLAFRTLEADGSLSTPQLLYYEPGTRMQAIDNWPLGTSGIVALLCTSLCAQTLDRNASDEEVARSTGRIKRLVEQRDCLIDIASEAKSLRIRLLALLHVPNIWELHSEVMQPIVRDLLAEGVKLDLAEAGKLFGKLIEEVSRDADVIGPLTGYMQASFERGDHKSLRNEVVRALKLRIQGPNPGAIRYSIGTLITRYPSAS